MEWVVPLWNNVQEMSCSEELLGGGYIPVRDKGVRVWDDICKYYINCTSQFWGLYLGYAND